MSIQADLERHKARIKEMRKEGTGMVKEAHSAAPSATAGIFGVDGYDAWEPGKSYAAGDVFTYNGAVGFVRQAHTSQETWLPFTTGTESLYGARPAPDADGVYPYTYNMAASLGMLVRENETVYRCIQAIDFMGWPPSQLAAHFEPVTE